MIFLDKLAISNTEPNQKNVVWVKPVSNTTFELKIFGSNGWTTLSGLVGPQGPKGDKGDKGAAGPAGADGKSVTAMTLTTDATGKVTGGTATLTGGTTVPITVTVES